MQYLAKYGILQIYSEISVPRKIGTLYHREELLEGSFLKIENDLNVKLFFLEFQLCVKYKFNAELKAEKSGRY